MDSSGTALPRERMEEMLTDYALGSLSKAEIPLFEQSLPMYPDIQEDVRRIREAFAQFDKEDYLERQTRPARTLSVHVQQRLAGRRSLSGNRALRHAVPALGLAVIALLIFAPGGFLYHSGFVPSDTVMQAVQPGVASSEGESLLARVITLQNVAQMVEESHVADPLDILLGMADQTPMSNVVFIDELDIALGEGLAMSDEMVRGLAENVLFPMSDYSLGGGLYDGLQETEVQQLLEELDNALL